MDRFINFMVAQISRLCGWLFGTRNGWIMVFTVLFAGILYFQPELLANMVKNVLAGLIGLIGNILGGILNGAVKVLQANQQSIEYLFCIALLLFGAVLMFRAISRKGGTKK